MIKLRAGLVMLTRTASKTKIPKTAGELTATAEPASPASADQRQLLAKLKALAD
jgi:hypothetical protein